VTANGALVPYDEFGLFHENVAEYRLDVELPPVVRRTDVALAGGRVVSALVWGDAPPELVLVHGGAQNAHTWDTVALALGRPVLAVDLPGHGHSAWRDDAAYDPVTLAGDLAVVVEQLAPAARLVVGMSLGGLTSMALAARRPDLVRSLVLVDITPGVDRQKAKAVIDFVDGPQQFANFDDLLARTIEHNPTRSVSSLRRGILHNARQEPDGTWRWRYDRSGHTRDVADVADDAADASRYSPLWDDLAALRCPVLLVRGGSSPVVDDADVAEARRRLPGIEVVVVDGAGHSVQGDRPLELAALLAALLGALL
jgi:pimeloyl-ACP methyl ester carboxylesterase